MKSAQNSLHFAEGNSLCISVKCIVCILVLFSLKFAPQGSINLQSVTIDLGNGLAPNIRQPVTQTTDDPIHLRMYRLTQYCQSGIAEK